MIPKTIINANTIHTFFGIFISTTSTSNYTLFSAKDKPIKNVEKQNLDITTANLFSIMYPGGFL
jgi:hypothetical protein